MFVLELLGSLSLRDDARPVPASAQQKRPLGQRWVVAPIHLTRGASLRWPLPTGRFFLSFSADSSQVPTTRGFSGLFGSSSIAQFPISMRVAGPIRCVRMSERNPGVLDTYCLARAPGATVHIVRAGPGGVNEIVGSLGLERQEEH